MNIYGIINHPQRGWPQEGWPIYYSSIYRLEFIVEGELSDLWMTTLEY